MTYQVILPAGSPPPLAPYSPGVLRDGVLYVSGMLAMEADGATHGVGDARSQTRRVLESVRSVVEAAGGSMKDVVHNAIFLKDLADYQAMNEVYAEFFPERPPARYCIRADLVRPDFLVEVSAVAHIAGPATP
ncbi:MAG: pyrimidine utilization protein C [Comamonadaceae bacterium]|nr:MAG: pyrimidine utilization protein C [Comamonadaceae bacterium]